MIKTLYIALIVVVGFCSCSNDKKEEKRKEKKELDIGQYLITDTSWGAITYNADIEKLKEIFGAENIKNETICGPECVDSIEVTKVFPESNKELVIYWLEDQYHKSISMIVCYAKEAPYHTASGIKIGSTLKDLLNENGRPIVFSGFGWDYGGYINSYSGGKLESSAIRFRMDLLNETENNNFLYGDNELSTDMPTVKNKIDEIKIYQITLSL